MRRSAVSRGIEATLERVLERPFLRRTSVNLPLLRGALLRAMEDELKPVVPSRYTITVPAEQLSRARDAREEWEKELVGYFGEALRSHGWSAIGEPRVTIAYDARLTGNQVQVAVEEPGLIHNGGTFPRSRNRGPVTAIALAALIICLAVLVAMLRPDLLGGLQGKQPGATPPSRAGEPWDNPSGGTASWWDGARSAILGWSVGESTGEVTASPCLLVRAGAPGGAGASRAGSCVPAGTVLTWRQDRVVKGEPIADEDRWIGIGTAGPEWGARAGQPLYVWMGGLRVR